MRLVRGVLIRQPSPRNIDNALASRHHWKQIAISSAAKEPTPELKETKGQRRRVEQALPESDAPFRYLLEHVGEAVFILGRDGRIIDVNQHACDSLGYSREELLKLSGPDVDVEWDATKVAEFFDQLVPGVAVTAEGTQRRKDGTTFPVEGRMALIELGGRQCMLSLARDLSERKRADDKLLQQTRELAVLEERTRLAREIHDTLAQSLVGLHIQLEAAEEFLDQDPTAARAEIHSARALTRDSLEEVRRSVWDLQPLALSGGALAEAIHRELTRTREQGIRTSVEVEGAGPESIDRRCELAVLRIVQEALSNVRQHSEANSVAVSVAYTPSTIKVSISDDGVGFEPSSSRGMLSPTGGGFGLTSMQERARLAGGRIEVRGAPGMGTQIELAIPYQPPAQEVRPLTGPSMTVSRPQTSETGVIRVLVVDDHEVARQGIRNIVEQANDLTVVGEAGDGEAGIEQIQTLSPDVVLMDIRMPKLDGVDTLRRLRELGIDTPVILLSVYVEDEHIFEGLKAGARGYLTKDVSRDDLTQAIRTVYEGGSLLQPVIASRLIRRLDTEPATDLTEREKDVLQLLVSGAPDKKIAKQLSLSVNTVRFHITNIFQKLGVESRTEAAHVAHERSLLTR